MVMSDSDIYGLAFTAALKKSDVKPADLARSLGVNPQRITHWKKRGVSAKFAHAVAEMLKVDPRQISGLEVLDASHLIPQRQQGAIDNSITLSPEEHIQLHLTDKVAQQALIKLADKVSPKDALAIARYFLDRAASGQ